MQRYRQLQLVKAKHCQRQDDKNRSKRPDDPRVLEHGRKPVWIVIADQGRILATVTEDQLDKAIADLEPDNDHEAVSLEAGHGERCAVLTTDASLREALAAMDERDAHVAVVTGPAKRESGSVYGILTRSQIEAAVRYGG